LQNFIVFGDLNRLISLYYIGFGRYTCRQQYYINLKNHKKPLEICMN